MKIVHQLKQFSLDYITFCDPVYNTVIDSGTFVRFLYSSPTYSLSSIYIELPFHEWTPHQYVTTNESGNSIYKLKCNFDWTQPANENVVKWLSDMETALLEKYEIHRTLSVPNTCIPCKLLKTREYGIYTQVANGCVRISNKMGPSMHASFTAPHTHDIACSHYISPSLFSRTNSNSSYTNNYGTIGADSFSTSASASSASAGVGAQYEDMDTWSCIGRDMVRCQQPLEQNQRWNFKESSSSSASASALSSASNASFANGVASTSSYMIPTDKQSRHRELTASNACMPSPSNSSIILKITGIWETDTTYGLTFKFQLVSK